MYLSTGGDFHTKASVTVGVGLFLVGVSNSAKTSVATVGGSFRRSILAERKKSRNATPKSVLTVDAGFRRKLPARAQNQRKNVRKMMPESVATVGDSLRRAFSCQGSKMTPRYLHDRGRSPSETGCSQRGAETPDSVLTVRDSFCKGLEDANPSKKHGRNDDSGKKLIRTVRTVVGGFFQKRANSKIIAG